jgi:hypothetical protein
MTARVHQHKEIVMETFLILLIVVLSVSICALTAFWFIRDAQSRNGAKPLYVPRSSVAYHRWEGKASHRHEPF